MSPESSPERALCPICGRRFSLKGPKALPPFCGERCRVIDLGNWLDGTYQPPWLLEPEELEALHALEGAEPEDED